ncbi:hypothetical protein ACP4OV_005902 [Aristida adscensionis]
MARAATVTALLALSRRGYAAAAAAGAELLRQRAPPAARAASGASEGGAAASKEVSWMPDPRTGCWVPEDRFADVDAAELRARLLAWKDQ